MWLSEVSFRPSASRARSSRANGRLPSISPPCVRSHLFSLIPPIRNPQSEIRNRHPAIRELMAPPERSRRFLCIRGGKCAVPVGCPCRPVWVPSRGSATGIRVPPAGAHQRHPLTGRGQAPNSRVAVGCPCRPPSPSRCPCRISLSPPSRCRPGGFRMVSPEFRERSMVREKVSFAPSLCLCRNVPDN